MEQVEWRVPDIISIEGVLEWLFGGGVELIMIFCLTLRLGRLFAWLVVAVHLPCGLLKFDLGLDTSHVSATSRGGLAFNICNLQEDEKTRRREDSRKGGSCAVDVNQDDATGTRHAHNLTVGCGLSWQCFRG